MDRRTSSGLAVDDIILDNGHYPYIHVDFNAFRRIKNNQSVRNLALHPELVRLGAFLAIATIADGFIYLAWAETGAIQTVHFPLLFVATNFVYLLAAIPVGNLADKLGRPVVSVLGYGCLLASYLCVVLADGFLGMTVCVIFLGLYYAATDGVLSALAAPLLPEHVRSSGLSAVQATQAIGRAGGAVAFGFVWFSFGLATAIWCFVSLLAGAILIAAVLLRRNHPATAEV